MDKIIFAQLLNFIPRRKFKSLAKSKDKLRRSDSLTALEQFICMAFAQLTNCSGLRDIETSLMAMSHKVYHLGLQNSVSKSNLSRVNNKRPSIVFKSLAELLIKEARELYKDEAFENLLDEVVYILDSTYISLCLSLFPWGQVGKQKIAGLKVHTLLDLKGSIPTFIEVTGGSHSDNRILDKITIEAGAIYVFDKAYIDFKRLDRIDEARGYFVARFKKNIAFSRTTSNQITPETGVMLDQVGKFTGSVGKRKYQNKIRKVVFHDRESNRTLTFMTNNFSLKPEVIAKLYKHRWRIEIFFKWIKQNLRIKKFYGTSENAVETQIWIAISTYLLVTIAKKKLNLEQPLAQILHILSFSLFEKESLSQILNRNNKMTTRLSESNQLNLFDYK